VELGQALDVQAGEQVAFVGAGGKTAAAWRVLRELTAAGHATILTTTTHILEPADLPLLLESNPDAAQIRAALTQAPAIVLAAGREEGEHPEAAARSFAPVRPVKLVGLAPGRIDGLALLPGVTWLIEADGARGHELKAPAEYEPVIPPSADRVIVVAGLHAIGRPLDDQVVHRPERAAHLLGVPPGTVITGGHIARLLVHPAGGLKGVPDGAALVALLTQREATPPHPDAPSIAERLLAGERFTRVVLAALRAAEPVLEVWSS